MQSNLLGKKVLFPYGYAGNRSGEIVAIFNSNTNVFVTVHSTELDSSLLTPAGVGFYTAMLEHCSLIPETKTEEQING